MEEENSLHHDYMQCHSSTKDEANQDLQQWLHPNLDNLRYQWHMSLQLYSVHCLTWLLSEYPLMTCLFYTFQKNSLESYYLPKKNCTLIITKQTSSSIPIPHWFYFVASGISNSFKLYCNWDLNYAKYNIHLCTFINWIYSVLFYYPNLHNNMCNFVHFPKNEVKNNLHVIIHAINKEWFYNKWFETEQNWIDGLSWISKVEHVAILRLLWQLMESKLLVVVIVQPTVILRILLKE